MLWNNTVSDAPHELTLFTFQPQMDAATMPFKQNHRDECVCLMGAQQPYDYSWVKDKCRVGSSDNPLHARVVSMNDKEFSTGLKQAIAKFK